MCDRPLWNTRGCRDSSLSEKYFFILISLQTSRHLNLSDLRVNIHTNVFIYLFIILILVTPLCWTMKMCFMYYPQAFSLSKRRFKCRFCLIIIFWRNNLIWICCIFQSWARKSSVHIVFPYFPLNPHRLSLIWLICQV